MNKEQINNGTFEINNFRSNYKKRQNHIVDTNNMVD
jgi:hypothetical protein